MTGVQTCALPIYGIRILLDVISHGVMKDSPLIQEHPDWFKSGSWGMADFDWFGGHKDLDDWWVDVWTKSILDWGVDGFRIDCDIYRPDLWARVRHNAADAGKEILIIGEGSIAQQGVTDSTQGMEVITFNNGLNKDHPMLHDVAGYLNHRRTLGDRQAIGVEIEYADGEKDTYPNGKLFLDFCETAVEPVHNEAPFAREVCRLRVKNAEETKEIQKISANCGRSHAHTGHNDLPVTYTRLHGEVSLSFPMAYQRDQVISVQLSCHDNGWDGWPEDQNPFGIQGSRYLMGYCGLMAPAMPIMMSGEEFDAEYRPIPWHANDLYGKKEPGSGRWLYGAWLDWDQLKLPRHAGMLSDTRKLLALRKRFGKVIKPFRFGKEPACPVVSPPFTCKLPVPAPYAYPFAEGVLLVAANPHQQPVDITVDLDGAFTACEALFGETARLSGDGAAQVTVTVKPDRVEGGGLTVVLLRKAPAIRA